MSVRMIQDLLVKFKQADTIKDFTALLTDIKELFQVKEQTDVLTSESFEEVPEILKELPIVGKVSVKPSSVEEIEAEPSTAADSETQGNVFRRLKLNTVTHAHTDTKVNAKGMEISISKHLDTIAINVQKSLQQKLQNIDMHHKAPNAAPVAAPFVAPAPAPLAAAAAAPGHVPAAVGAPVGPVGGPVAAAGVPAAVPGKVAKTSATPSVSAKPAAPVAVPADGIASKFVKAGSQVAEAISKLTKSVLGSTTQAARDDVVDAVADAILSKPAQAQANPAVEVKPAVDLTAVVADALAQKPAQDQANAAPVVKPAVPVVDLTAVVADALAQNPAQEPAEDYSFKNMAGKLLGLLPFGKKAPAVVQDKPAADLSTIVGEAIAQKPAHDQANTAPAIKPAAPAVDLTSVVADAVVQKSAPAVDLTTVVADAVAQQSSQEQVKNDKLVDDVAAAILAVDHPDAKKVNDVADLITATVTSEPAPAVVLPPPPPPPPMVAPTSAANGEKKKWDAVQVGDVSASGKKDASVAAKAPNVKQQPADLLAAITKGTALKKTGLDAAGELHQPKQFSERTSGSGSDKGILGKLADAMGEKISQKPTRSGLVEILANAIAGSKKSVATSQVQVEEEESDFDKEARLEALKDSNKAAIQNLAADKAVTDDVKLGLIEAGTKATSTMMSEIQRVSDLYANKLKAAIPAADQAPLQGKVQELSEKAFLAISQQLSQHAAKTAGMLYQDALARGLQKQFTLDQEIPPAAMATALDKLTKGTDLFDYVETSLRNSMQQILAEETKSLTDANKDRVHELHLDAAVENLNKALSADISVIRKEVSALHPQEVKAAFKASSAVVGIDMAAIMAERRKGIDGADKKADTDTDDSKPAVKKADSLVTKVADAIVSDNHDQDGASKKLDKSVHSSSTSESDTSSVGSFHTPVASPVGSVLGTKDSKPVDDKHSVTPDSLADLIVQESPIFAEPAQTQQTGGGIFGGLANLAHQGLDFGKNLFGGFFGGAKPEPVTLQGVVQQADEIPGLENSAKPDSGKPLSASGLVDLVADTVVSGALLGANPASNPTSAKPLSDSGVVDLVANAVVSGALLQPPHVEQTHVDAHL